MSSTLPKPSKKGSNKLTDKQIAFVEAYLADNEMNASEAARQAGYSSRSAGDKLLRNKEVAKEIGKRMKQRSDKMEITSERVLQELASVGFVNIMDYMNEDGTWKMPHELTREQSAAICGVRQAWNAELGKLVVLGYEFWDKQWAIGCLLRHLGMEGSVKVDMNMNIESFISTIVTNASRTDNDVIDGNVIKQAALENKK